MIYLLKLKLKKIILNFIYILLKIFKNNITHLDRYETVMVYLPKPLGIGDQIMLLPYINFLTKYFHDIYIYTNCIELYKNNNSRITFIKSMNDVPNECIIIVPKFVFSVYKFIFKKNYIIGAYNYGILKTNYIYKIDQKEFWYELSLLNSYISESMDEKYEKVNLELNSKPYPIKIEGRYITLCIESNWITREYDYDKWILLIEHLAETNKFKIVVIGNKKYKIKFNKNIINLTSSTDISYLNNIISNSELYIGTDSGTAHIANYFNVKSIILFGSVNPNQRLVMENTRLRPLVNEGICNKFPCYNGITQPNCNNPICIKSITINQIIKNINELLVCNISYYKPTNQDSSSL